MREFKFIVDGRHVHCVARSLDEAQRRMKRCNRNALYLCEVEPSMHELPDTRSERHAQRKLKWKKEHGLR